VIQQSVLIRIPFDLIRVVNLLVRTSLHESTLLQKEKLQNAYLVLGGNSKIFQRKWMHLDVKTTNESVNKTSKILLDSPLRHSSLDNDDDELSSNYEDSPFTQQRLFMKSRLNSERDVDDSTFKVVLVDRDLDSLEDSHLYDLRLLRFELIHYLNAVENVGKQQMQYFQSIDLNRELSEYLRCVGKVFGVRGAKLKPFHPNLFSTATQLYFRKFQLDHLDATPDALEFVAQIVFESSQFCKSYELYCLLRYFVQKYIEMYCDKHLVFCDHLLTFDLAEIEQKVVGFESQNTPSSPPINRKTRRGQALAPRKAVPYKMDELKEYVEELYRKGRSTRNVVPEVFTMDDSSDDDVQVLKVKEPTTAKKTMSVSRITRSQSRLPVSEEFELNENLSQKVLKTAQKKPRSKSRLVPVVESDPMESCLLQFDKLDLGSDLTLIDSELAHFKRKTNNQTEEEFVITMLRDLLLMFDFRPPIDTYNFVARIMFKLSSSRGTEAKVQESAYYFTEMVTGNSLRYQAMLTHGQRIKSGTRSFEMKLMNFDTEEKMFLNQLPTLMNALPSGWRVVQVQQVWQKDQSIPDLYLCRLEANSQPILVKIKGNSSKVNLFFFFVCLVDLKIIRFYSFAFSLHETSWTNSEKFLI
jgi:hypothetical protein